MSEYHQYEINSPFWRYQHIWYWSVANCFILQVWPINCDRCSVQATVYVTDAASNYHFESCSRMLYALSRAAVVHHSERLYVFGGYDGGGTARRALQSFDMNTGQWTEVTSSVDDVPMSCQYAVCIDELIYVVTGEATSGGRPDATTGSVVKRRCADSLYTFNPRTLQWCHLARLPEPPHTGSFCATTLGGRIYLTGGLRGGRPYFAVDCFNVADNTVETVGNTAEGSLSLCSTIRVMHENFGLWMPVFNHQTHAMISDI